MGIYIYKLEPKTRKHPVYGEVGVLRFWDRLAWYDGRAVERQERAIARHNQRWAGRVPKFVVIRWEGHGVDMDDVREFHRERSAVWYDTEPLTKASPPE